MQFIKYPRTFHLPSSPGATSDDKMHKVIPFTIGDEVVITEKMDGENQTMYNNHVHARSVDSRHHPSRDWMKKFHASIAYMIPEGFRICGEYLYAKHSIAYDDLKSYFYGFSVWEGETCLDCDSTCEYFELLGIESVPVLYRGPYYDGLINNIVSQLDFRTTEGFVVRPACSFNLGDFSKVVGKYVRANHVQSEEHWMHSAIVPNKLSGIT